MAFVVVKQDEKTNVIEVAFTGVSSDSLKAVVIPDEIKAADGTVYKVTKIADDAFKGSDITSVTIGKNITDIGDGAFKDAKDLKTVKGGQNLQKIGDGAFAGCTNLKKIDLTGCDNITLGSKVFDGDASLKEIKVKAGTIDSADKNAFSGLSKKTKIIVVTEGKTKKAAKKEFKKTKKELKAAGAKKIKFKFKKVKTKKK
jgi:hypothetical protein